MQYWDDRLDRFSGVGTVTDKLTGFLVEVTVEGADFCLFGAMKVMPSDKEGR